MPGAWINPRQVEMYMNSRKSGRTQIVSAAKAGISQRSGRNIEHLTRIDPHTKKRTWRTRHDPLQDVWQSELVLMLEKSPSLSAITLLEYIQTKYPDTYSDSVLRTLQRRVKKWQVLHGPDKEVMFRQYHEIGRQGLSDFTKLKKVNITINNKPFDHLLYHFRLAYSHWSSMKVIQGGESYPALAEGLSEALQKLGGCPKEHRTDSLSAAFKNMSREAQEDLTVRYDSLCRNYGMIATRNNRGQGHENGSIESPHGHLKRRIEQALILRGSFDFKDINAYQEFIDQVVDQSNRRNAKSITIERPALLPLPQTKAISYNEMRVIVNSSSTISVRRVLYTVPSRLQGQVLNVHIYDDRLICYFGAEHVITLKRIHCLGSTRGRQINYRHVIHSLVKKPQAFRYSRLRDDLLPSDEYRLIWQQVNQAMSATESCKFMVGLLFIAAHTHCQQSLAQSVMDAVINKVPLSLKNFERFYQKQICSDKNINITHETLDNYNQFIPQVTEACYV